MPVVHARDAAQGKAASIGVRQPEAGGLGEQCDSGCEANGIARGLGWFIRDQVVFNQSVVTCVETLMESVNELNRSMVSLGAQIGERLDQGRQQADGSAFASSETREPTGLRRTRKHCAKPSRRFPASGTSMFAIRI